MRRPVFLAMLTALAVRTLVVAKLPAPAAWDGTLYVDFARDLVHGHGYVLTGSAPPVATAFYPVGYPAALALVMRVFGTSMHAVFVLNVASAALAAGCAAALGYHLADRRGAYFAGFAYALAPGPALWSAAAMTETLTGALLVAGTVLAMDVGVKERAPTLARAAWSGLVIGLCALVRPQALLVAPILGGIPRARRRWLGVMLATAAALAVVLPWTARNCHAMDGCVLVSTNGGSNLLIGTMPDVEGGYRHLTPGDGCWSVMGEVARDRCRTTVAVGRIARAPVAWLRLAVRKLVRTFGIEWSPVSYLRTAIPGVFTDSRAHGIAIASSVWWWVLCVFAIVGGRRAWQAGGRARALAQIAALQVLLFTLTHAVFLGEDRYHLPLVPVVAALAAGVFLPSRRESGPEFAWVG